MRIVILGGDFCEALMAKKLDSSRKLEITLIDQKNYFEYIPLAFIRWYVVLLTWIKLRFPIPLF